MAQDRRSRRSVCIDPESEFRVDQEHPTGSAGRGMNVTDVVGQERRLKGPGRQATSPPFVESRPRHLKRPARHRHREPGGGKFEDEPEPYFGGTLSFAK